MKNKAITNINRCSAATTTSSMSMLYGNAAEFQVQHNSSNKWRLQQQITQLANRVVKPEAQSKSTLIKSP